MMTLPVRILLFNTALLLAITLAATFATDTFPGNGFFLMFGFIAFAATAAALGLGLLLLLRADKRPARGFLWSGFFFALLGAVAYWLLGNY